MKSLQGLARAATRIVWLTVGGLLSGQNPDQAVVSGLARSLRSENAAIDLITYEFDPASNTIDKMKEIAMKFADRQAAVESVVDAENLVENGIVYVSRLAPIDGMNSTCGPCAKASEPENIASLKAMVQSRYREDELQLPKDSQAEVKISSLGTSGAVSLNAPTTRLESNQNKEIFDLTGLSNHPASIYEIGGIVTAIGSGVSHLKVGDKVVGFSSDNFSSSQRTLAMLLCPIEDTDSFEVGSCDGIWKIFLTKQMMLTLPTAFSTAIYGLNELAHLEEGEVYLRGCFDIHDTDFCYRLCLSSVTLEQQVLQLRK